MQQPTASQVAAVAPPERWECACSRPPVLLATYDAKAVYVKHRDRFVSIARPCRVLALCPRCGRVSPLILRRVR